MTAVTDDSADLAALRELADDIFSAAVEPALDIQQVGLPYDPDLWATLAGSGLTLLTTPESAGGTGAGVPELAVVLESSGYHAAPVPVAEHDLLASWLLGAAGLELPEGTMTAAVTTAEVSDGQLQATVGPVPWGAEADVLVLAGSDFVAALDPASYTAHAGADIAGQPNAVVTLDIPQESLVWKGVPADLTPEFRLRGAWARALQTSGALARALELTIDHARQREQFGRPISKFQAVQTLIADSANALAVAKTAAYFATDVVSTHGFDSQQGRFAVSVAKIESARAATTVARNAHQVHGAIGFTLDHRLRHFTNRALAWRSQFGSPAAWQRQLGQSALAADSSVWEWVTAMSGHAGPTD